MNKFKFLVKFGLKKRIFKKSFIITNAILGIIIIGIVNLPSIIAMFQDEEEVETLEVAIVNESDDESYPLEDNLITMFNASYMEYEYESSEATLEDNEDFWDHETLDILLVFTGDLDAPDVEVYAKSEEQRSFLTSQVQTLLNDYQDITYANYVIQSPPDTGDDDGGLNEENRTFIEGIVSILFLPIFVLIIMATQFLGVDIIEEKSSKAIETIIASVPAKTHFLSKITSSISFLLIQSSILLAFGILASFIGRLLPSINGAEELSLFAELANRIPNWPSLLVFSVLFMIFGTLLFLTLAAFVASVATTQEDYQQFQAPLIFLLLGGYYIGIFLPMLGADGVVQVAAYIPFFSTIVAPIAYATGVITIFESIIILLITIATAVGFLYIIAPVYKVAILSYQETRFFKRITFYIKKAFAKSK
ncbi:MAG: ABC transporter permease [Bacillota bacterium]